MGRFSSLLWGATIGAGLMYFRDPQNGERRQAMLRDRVYRLRNQGDEALDTAVTDLRKRASGLLSEGVALISDESVPDRVLEERVRARLGFLTRHPRAVQVSVQDRVVQLSGDILADEVDSLVKGVGRVRGIRDVRNDLRAHQEAGNIAQLQGKGELPGEQPAAAMWSPSTRLLAGAGAMYLVSYGMGRGGLVGLLARLSGFALGARAVTNMDLGRLSGANGAGEAVRVRKSIEINAPVEEVYALWSNFENFPRFMNNIEAIHATGERQSHWVVKGPVGSKVEFNATTTEMIPNELLAWETSSDSQVKHRGQVRFRRLGDNRTQVNVMMHYTPPAGAAGHAVAALFGKDPKTEMDADLARMKSLLEHGKTSAGQTVRREEVMPVTGQDQKMDDSGQDSDTQPASLMEKDNELMPVTGDSGEIEHETGDDWMPLTGQSEQSGGGEDEEAGDSGGMGPGSMDYDANRPRKRKNKK